MLFILKRLHNLIKCGLSISCILLFLNSCDKKPNSLPDDNEVYTVAVKFQEFESLIYPWSRSSKASSSSMLGSARNRTGEQSAGYLYYWSFNQQSPVPDVALHAAAAISYNGGKQPVHYTATGWASNGYPAGQAMSITGLETLVIEMPMEGVSELIAFGFDISSSATGPKDFSIWYGQDGLNYQLLAEENQFSNTSTAYGKNVFRYYLEELPLDFRAPVFIKLIAKAGDRGGGSNYNPKQGVTRFDNIYLYGASSGGTSPSIQQVDYRIFEQETGSFVQMGRIVLDDTNIPTFSLELPKGVYKAVFVYNASDEYLLMPEAVAATDFYVANPFSNSQAQVFAEQKDFKVQEDLQLDLLLNRLYSQVKFEFTDGKPLAGVGVLKITPLHSPFFYAPFPEGVAYPVVDESFIVEAVDLEKSGRTFVFNQFMGQPSTDILVAYTIDVFDQDGVLLRSFTLESMLRNNVQLVFRGALLVGQYVDTNFSIRIHTEWDGFREVFF